MTSILARIATRDAIAVEDLVERLTYPELDARANAIAQHLVALGVGRDTLVGICTRPSVATVAAMLGVLKANAAFVPLDITYPAPRLGAMLADSRLAFVLVDGACAGAPVLASVQQILIDRAIAPPVHADTDPAQLAYVVFTSGSTGRPKGVAVTHAGLVNLVDQQNVAFAIDEESRVLQFAALGFDAVISEVFTTLVAGATLVLEERGPGADIAEVLRRRRISVVTLPPSLLRVLEDVPGLRTVVSAGEACTPEIVARWSFGRRFVNAYGPSECTVCATVSSDASIGRAIAGVTTYVLDAQLALAVEGELYLAGPALARGYLGLPGLTAERFVPDPFAGGRMYRTGDRVRVLANGTLEYLGRTDDQVKVRGFRVEPREVEAALRGPDAEVIVLPRTRAAGELTLVAYVVANGIDERGLRERARARLPAFLCPSEYVLLAAWPLTPNGKIDRTALAARRAAIAPAAPPRTPAEHTVAELARRVLDVTIDLDRSFFDQGGDSIAAARMAIALAAAFERRVPVGILFAHPTLRALATAIEAPAQSPVVKLREGSGRPIWLPAPVHGNALCYMRFASYLGDARCYGLQMPGLDGEAAPIDDFVALATHQLQIVRAHQPHGPYTFVGWSLGGSLAFEMAVQLERAGEQATLVLIGCTPPSADHLAAARATMQGYEPWRMAYFYLRTLAFSLGIPIALDFAQLPDDQALARFVAQVRTLGPLGADIDPALAERWLAVVRASLYGFHHQTPSGQFGGHVLSVVPTGANPLMQDTLVRAQKVPPGDWANHLVGSVDTVEVAGNHYTLMAEPWVAEVARVVAAWLLIHSSR